MSDFDCIVVGAGVCGTTAAMKMAKGGLNVLLIDRGKPIGSKNLSGGVIWGHDLEEVIPDWWKEGLAAGAIERPITQKGINLLTKESAFTVQFGTEDWKRPPYNAFSVLRARFDKWLSERAAEEKVNVVDGVNIQKLARGPAGEVVGVEQDGGVISADAVLVADGCNSRLAMELGLREKLDREHWVLGVKEVVKLDEKVLNDRFRVGPNEGVAHEYVLGWLENGAKAGGFLYTNRDTVSLGAVISLDSIWEKQVYTHRIMEEFRLHPNVSAMLAGGELVEYGAHLIPEAGMQIVPQLWGDNWMISGDAAGFVYSNGLVIHGMNYAARSGLTAAQAALDAKAAGKLGRPGALASYEKGIKQSYIWKDFKRFKSMHGFVWDENIHKTIPGLVEGVFKEMFTARMEPKKKTAKILREQVKASGAGPISLAKTALKGARSV